MVTNIDVADFPTQPGIYIFSTNGEPVYIGKSVNIKARVLSHIAQSRIVPKERKIVLSADQVTFITTFSNLDALLLESQLIRKHKPKYNVVWRDDKHPLYIKVTLHETYPRITAVRRENDGVSKYFGPFSSTHVTNNLIYDLRRLYPFCTSKKISQRPCFYSKIGLCNPCPNYIESLGATGGSELKKELQKKYKENIRHIVKVLSGKADNIILHLEQTLSEYSENRDFEKAIPIRNRILHFYGFLQQRKFAQDDQSHDIDQDDLSRQFKEFMLKHFNYKTEFSFRVECFDISNLFGKQPTASMVVFQDGAFNSGEYRKFSIKYDKISDIAMMEEAIKRRLTHSEWRKPDLVILDGGKPQLRKIHSLFRRESVDIPLLSIAKRPDRIITPNGNFKTIYLEKNSTLFKLVQGLRDESHRFAKKYHLLLRGKNTFETNIK